MALPDLSSGENVRTAWRRGLGLVVGARHPATLVTVHLSHCGDLRVTCASPVAAVTHPDTLRVLKPHRPAILHTGGRVQSGSHRGPVKVSAGLALSGGSWGHLPPAFSASRDTPDAIGPTRIIQGRLLVSAPFILITSAKSLFTRQGTHSQAPATRAWPRVVPVRETVTWELGALGPPGAGPQALGFLSALPITILSLPLGPPSLPLEAHRRLMQGPPSLHTGAGTPQVRGPAPVARLEHCGWGQACRQCCPQRPPGHSGMGTLCQAPQWPLWATWALHPGGAGSGGNRAGGQGAAWGGARRREKGEGGARRG